MKKNNHELTLEEKLSLLYGNNNWHIHSNPNKGVPDFELHDGPLGCRKVKDGGGADLAANSQKATCFPAPALLACSFDPNVVSSVSKQIGLECIDQEFDMLLAPGMNIKRNPLCGRNFEYFSEDPLLAGKLAGAYIKGIQGVGVGACLKHYACNSQEKERFISDSIVDSRALQEIYLKGFGIAIKEGNPWAVMCAYNLVNGVYACEHDYLIGEVLRKQFKFDGVLMSDWGATFDYVTSHNHGLDLEMPCSLDRSKVLKKAYESGELNNEMANESIRRMIEMANKKFNKATSGSDVYLESHNVARLAAEKSIVLLKNNKDMLPLSNFNDVAIIGSFAKHPRYQGNGSSIVNTNKLVSFLDCCREKGVEAEFAPGLDEKGEFTNDKLMHEAIDLASRKKKVVLFLGLPSSYESEGYDRPNMKLPDDQIALFDSIYKINKNVCVILSCGAPVEMPFADNASAILLTYLTGEAGGEALFNILSGKTSPSGKLSETWPIRYFDVPNRSYYPGVNRMSLYKDSIYVGYRYYLSAKKAVRFPFGHGLSYAKFQFGDLKLDKKEIKSGFVKASVEVKNVSKIDSELALQIYSSLKKSKLFRPARELISFAKLMVPAGAKKTFEFKINFNDFAIFDDASSSFKVEGGDYLLELGESSLNIVSSETIKLISDFVPASKQKLLPSYYVPSKEGMDVSNFEFEALLGRKLPPKKDYKKRPFGLNSTLDDISSTWIGKKIYKSKMKEMMKVARDESEARMYLEGSLTTPFRAAHIGRVSEKQVYALLAMANGKPFKALKYILFGVKK